jgi:hypothetical protein
LRSRWFRYRDQDNAEAYYEKAHYSYPRYAFVEKPPGQEKHEDVTERDHGIRERKLGTTQDDEPEYRRYAVAENAQKDEWPKNRGQ